MNMNQVIRDDIGLDEVDTLSKLHQMIDLQK